MKQDTTSHIRLLIFLLLLPLLVGCAATSLDVSLDRDNGVIMAAPTPVSIGVEEFVDRRPQAMGNDGKTRLGLIPGVFWLQVDSDLPEIYTAFSSFKSKPLNENTARSVVNALKSSKVTNKVIYLPDEPRTHIDYRIEGNLRQTLIKETGYYYGSAMYVWLPRILGAPYVSYEIAMDADMLLRDVKTEKIIWQGTITGQRFDHFLNIYQIANGRDGKHLIAYHFADIIAHGLLELIPQIHEALTSPTSPKYETK
ncbi:MAG: hypothetical protein OEM02_08780 [Desulfobulbaceae bacterium]|nr:hypothetical protein [Desulfobulbaceae bacterium]